jgi:hypothetical protein
MPPLAQNWLLPQETRASHAEDRHLLGGIAALDHIAETLFARPCAVVMESGGSRRPKCNAVDPI